jgi:hypothetical protein
MNFVRKFRLFKGIHDEMSACDSHDLGCPQDGLFRDLVRNRELTITGIAERLGYADVSSFSQAFKRWHLVSPEGFRDPQT